MGICLNTFKATNLFRLKDQLTMGCDIWYCRKDGNENADERSHGIEEMAIASDLNLLVPSKKVFMP